MLIAYLWIRQKWNDAYLRWNKEDYDGLEVIHIPSSLVWRPDLVLYNKYGFMCQSLKNTLAVKCTAFHKPLLRYGLLESWLQYMLGVFFFTL